jgi:hypothetical protein
MEDMFKIVNDFDKAEGYDKWLASQVPERVLAVVEEESSDEAREERKAVIVKPLRFEAVTQFLQQEEFSIIYNERKKRSV